MNLKYSALDLSFYEVDTATRRQYIGALISFEKDYTLAILEKNISKLPNEYPSILRRSVIENRIEIDPPYFEEHSLSEEFSTFVQKRMMSDYFYKNRMWEILYLKVPESEKCYILFRLHHSLADGVSGLNFFHDIIFNVKSTNRNRKAVGKKISFSKSLRAMYAQAILPRIKQDLKLTESVGRNIFFIKIPLSEINLLKRKFKVGIHQINLLISSEIYFSVIPNERIFRALIPVGLKEGRKYGVLGNYIGGTSLDIKNNDNQLVEKLKIISNSLLMKNTPDVYGAYLYFSKILKILPTCISKRVAQFESAKISAIVTSLNGPKTIGETLHYNEFAIPALMPGQNIGYGFIKNRDSLDITFIVDAKMKITSTNITDYLNRALERCEIRDWTLE